MRRFRTILLLAVAIVAPAYGSSLDSVLRQTVEHNPTIEEARLAVEQAAGRRITLRAAGLPTAGVGAVAGDLGGSRAGEDANQPFAFGTGAIVQPLFNVAIPAMRRLGDVGVLIAEQQLNTAIVSQLHSARLAFHDAQYNRALANLLAEQQQRLAANAESQRNLYQAGIAKRDVTLSADIATRELDPKIAGAHHDYESALLKLRGVTNAEVAAVDGNVAFIAREFDVAAATAAALRRRADLQLARLVVRSSSEEIQIAEANYLPSVNAVASGNYIPVSRIRQTAEDSPRRSDQFVSSEIRAGVGYTWRVLDAGIFDGAVGRKRAAREVNEIVCRRLSENIPRELEHIKNDLDALAARHEALSKAARVAEQNAVAIRDNFAQGRSSQLELRGAENSTAQVQTGLLAVAYQQSIARAEWDRATGAYLEISARE